jgi:hypothetical protein
MKLDIDLNAPAPDYAMFTDLGNAAVHALVEAARANKMTWAQTYQALHDLAKYDEFGEATDTAVREMVYDALGVEDEPFYV